MFHSEIVADYFLIRVSSFCNEQPEQHPEHPFELFFAVL